MIFSVEKDKHWINVDFWSASFSTTRGTWEHASDFFQTSRHTSVLNYSAQLSSSYGWQ